MSETRIVHLPSDETRASRHDCRVIDVIDWSREEAQEKVSVVNGLKRGLTSAETNNAAARAGPHLLY